MSTTPKVSVIIPVYNGMEFIERSIKSLLEQTLTDFEILVVDDCSTDDTVKILERLSNEDCRVRYFVNQNNQGQGCSRNYAISKAEGEYIAFVDSDDWMDPNALNLLYDKAQKLNAQIINFNVRVHKRDNKIVVSNNDDLQRVKFNESYLKNNEFQNSSDYQFSYCWNDLRLGRRLNCATTCWNYFCRLDFIKKNNIRFSSSRIGEDNLFAMMLNFYADRIYVISDALYNYCHREVSVENAKSDKVFSLETLFNEVNDFVTDAEQNNRDRSCNIREDFEYFKFRAILHRTKLVPDGRMSDYRALTKKLLSRKYYFKLLQKKFMKSLFSVETHIVDGRKCKFVRILFCRFKLS